MNAAYRVLEGHRSIVNHARYSSHNRLLFSSGVEKIIKVIIEISVSDLQSVHYSTICFIERNDIQLNKCL